MTYLYSTFHNTQTVSKQKIYSSLDICKGERVLKAILWFAWKCDLQALMLSGFFFSFLQSKILSATIHKHSSHAFFLSSVTYRWEWKWKMILHPSTLFKNKQTSMHWGFRVAKVYMKSSDAKASKCHLKFSSWMMIFIKLVYLSSVISLK